MTPTAPFVHFRAEFKPLLSSVNILLEFPRNVISLSPRLTIETNTVSVEADDFKFVFPFKHLTLKPSTCRGLRWNSQNELQLTFQADWNAKENKGGDADSVTIKNGFHSFNQEHLVSKIQTCQSLCYCMGCGAHLLKTSCYFKRVLPLPSENWSDFADIWFCHNHHQTPDKKVHSHCHSEGSTLPDNFKKVQQVGLSPRIDDCLVSSLYMLVSAKQVRPCAVTCTTDRLVCKRCGNFLGFVKLGDAESGEQQSLDSYFQDPLNGVYKIYFHAVSFREDAEEVPLMKVQVPQHLDSSAEISNNREQSIEDFMCNLLRDQSRLFTSFRFIIESSYQADNKSGVLILVWLLDQELAVFSSTTSPLSLPSAFSSSEKSATPSPLSSSSERSSTTSTPALSAQKDKTNSKPCSTPVPDITPCKYMKLLYKATFQPYDGSQFLKRITPDVFTAWQRDNTVHGISLPYSLCKQLLSLLITSTKQLTRSQRSLNGFHVGYLKTS